MGAWVWGCQEVLQFLESHLTFFFLLKFADLFNVAKKRINFSPAHGTEQDSVAILPANCWTSFSEDELLWSMIAWHLSKFASIPQFVNMIPKNFSTCILNEHFPIFNRMLYFLTNAKVSFKSSSCCPSYRVLETMSSMYTPKFLPICSEKTELTNPWYVAFKFLKPKGITSQYKLLWFIINVFFLCIIKGHPYLIVT